VNSAAKFSLPAFLLWGLCVSCGQADVFYTGVNLAGADFGGSNLPGTYNIHYTYPTPQEVDYYVDDGVNTFRIPFRWERLQRSQNAALHADELARLESIVAFTMSARDFPRWAMTFSM
jgi:hypothetical protein